MATANDISSAWEVGIFDAHCHPTDIMSAMDRIPKMKAKALTIMATRSQDQDLVADAARRFPHDDTSTFWQDGIGRVVPSFGWHPWFAHQIYDDMGRTEAIDPFEHYRSVLNPSPDDDAFLKSLPAPIALSHYLSQAEARLKEFPTALVGEIGLDRAFRVPRGEEFEPGDISVKTGGPEEGEFTPGSREGRPLSPYRVKMEHQKKIFKAQLQLAAKLSRPVSVHSVQAHGVIFELLQELWKGHERPSKRSQKKKMDKTNVLDREDVAMSNSSSIFPYPPRICMHSYSGPADALKQYLAPAVPASIYFSFSTLINFGSPASSKSIEVIQALPDDHILIESDLHCAGDRMDDLLEDIIQHVCTIKGWTLRQGAEILKRNWENFVFGD